MAQAPGHQGTDDPCYTPPNFRVSVHAIQGRAVPCSSADSSQWGPEGRPVEAGPEGCLKMITFGTLQFIKHTAFKPASQTPFGMHLFFTFIFSIPFIDVLMENYKTL